MLLPLLTTLLADMATTLLGILDFIFLNLAPISILGILDFICLNLAPISILGILDLKLRIFLPISKLGSLALILLKSKLGRRNPPPCPPFLPPNLEKSFPKNGLGEGSGWAALLARVTKAIATRHKRAILAMFNPLSVKNA